MSHVDEGQLHAYLDGGLSAMDAVRVERHLADCAPCRERLEEARRLVSRAAKLLEWASPPERAAPPLADLRPAAPQWRTPVAWAATIVIALGLGVYGGSQLLNRPVEPKAVQRFDTQERVPAATNLVTVAPIVVDSNKDVRAAEPAALGAAAPQPQPAARSVDTSARLQSALARAELDSLAKRRIDSLATNLAAATADRAVDVAPVRRESIAPAPPVAAREQRQEGRALRDSAPRIEALAVTGAEQQNRARASALAPVTTSWPIITRDSAARLLRGPIVALPDLPITAVRASADAVVVEHVVPPGQVIRLTERRAGAADEASAGFRSAKTSNESLARYVGGLRVEISGPLPADSLSKLLDRVRVVP